MGDFVSRTHHQSANSLTFLFPNLPSFLSTSQSESYPPTPPFSFTGISPNKSSVWLIMCWCLFLGGPKLTHTLRMTALCDIRYFLLSQIFKGKLIMSLYKVRGSTHKFSHNQQKMTYMYIYLGNLWTESAHILCTFYRSFLVSSFSSRSEWLTLWKNLEELLYMSLYSENFPSIFRIADRTEFNP